MPNAKTKKQTVEKTGVTPSKTSEVELKNATPMESTPLPTIVLDIETRNRVKASYEKALAIKAERDRIKAEKTTTKKVKSTKSLETAFKASYVKAFNDVNLEAMEIATLNSGLEKAVYDRIIEEVENKPTSLKSGIKSVNSWSEDGKNVPSAVQAANLVCILRDNPQLLDNGVFTYNSEVYKQILGLYGVEPYEGMKINCLFGRSFDCKPHTWESILFAPALTSRRELKVGESVIRETPRLDTLPPTSKLLQAVNVLKASGLKSVYMTYHGLSSDGTRSKCSYFYEFNCEDIKASKNLPTFKVTK